MANRDKGGAGGGLPFGLVSAVAAGGVENRDAYLSAGVAFDWNGKRVVIFDVVAGVGLRWPPSPEHSE